MKPFTGYLSGRIYYAKHIGLRWQVWYAYQDGEADPSSGATEWLACPSKFWRWINAERVAQETWRAFNGGVWCESGRAALQKGHGDER